MMNVHKLNREVLNLPEAHPARRFLCAFMECRRDCIGLEASDEPIDQEWFSESSGEKWSYSKFAYKFLAFDVVLDGWLTHAAHRTSNEQHCLDQLVRWRELLGECQVAAECDSNRAILPIIRQVLRMFDLWEQCILARDAATDVAYPRRVHRDLYPQEPDETEGDTGGRGLFS
jgi:hypothetical protein